VRLGLRLIVSFPEAAALRLMRARSERPFADIDDLARRAALDARELQTLARADARCRCWPPPPPAVRGRSGRRALLADAPRRQPSSPSCRWRPKAKP
jgi:hypothetical protein